MIGTAPIGMARIRNRRIVQLSTRTGPSYDDPLPRIDWNAVDRNCWWLPPDALSLSGVRPFETLPIVTRQRLSHCEYLHLLQIGLWLEALFVERLALLVHRTDDLDARADYLCEMREETGHSLMFVELIRRSGIALRPPRGLVLRVGYVLGRAIAPGSALFWALVVAGEELPNRLNGRLLRGVEEATLSAVVCRVARTHVRDEALHAAFARDRCEALTRRLPGWRRALQSRVLAPTLRALARHLHYPPEAIYASAGLHPAAQWRAAALRNPARRALADEMLAPTVDFLRRAGWRV